MCRCLYVTQCRGGAGAGGHRDLAAGGAGGAAHLACRHQPDRGRGRGRGHGASLHAAPRGPGDLPGEWCIELQTKVREDFPIMEKAPIME